MKLNEMEIKIKINSKEDFERIFNTCKDLCGSPLSHVLQLDEYYDTPDGQLRKQDLVIRIRSTSEGKTIALKSPRIELPSGITNRIELEFLSANGENVTDQLKNQGLNPHESSEKERWTFVHQNCEIALDKLPFIGYFIEIEGPSEFEIQEMVRLLNLSANHVVRQHYGELMKAKFLELQLPVSSICATFAREIELSNEKGCSYQFFRSNG